MPERRPCPRSPGPLADRPSWSGSALPAQNWWFFERLLRRRTKATSPPVHLNSRIGVSSVFLKGDISLTVIKFSLQRRATAAYRSLAKFFCGGRGATPGTYTLEGFLALLVKSYAWDLVFSHGHTVPGITLEEICIKYFGSRNNPIFLMPACVSFKEKNIFVRKIGYFQIWIAIIVEKPWTWLWGLSSRLPHTSYYVWRGNAARPLPGVVTLVTNWPSPHRVTPSCYSLPWSSFFCTVSCPVTSSELKSLDRRDFKAQVQQLLFQIPFGWLSSPSLPPDFSLGNTVQYLPLIIYSSWLWN